MTILSMNDSGPVDSNIYGMDSDQKRYDLCFREAKERGIHRKNKTEWKARLAKYKGHQT